MKVFKFGGASVKDAEAVKNVASILQKYREEKIVIVISAMGKTTNALECVVEAYYFESGDPFKELEKVKQFHNDLLDQLFSSKSHPVYSAINNFFVEIEWTIEEEKGKAYNFIYDQIVSVGELIGTKILSEYLNEIGIRNIWMDARDCIKTDDHYREAKIRWDETEKKTKTALDNFFKKEQFVITQGFIGCTSENNTSTLGREGSDFSASVLAFTMDAESVVIWKDVPGVLSADPKFFRDAQILKQLGYRDAVELSFYGAKVLHPKTIKPLENKKIPLYVRSFENPDEEGTLINEEYHPESIIPSYIFRSNQILISIATKDFSFIAEDHLSHIFGLFAASRSKIRLMQNSALSFSVCCDNDRFKMPILLEELSKTYDVRFNEQLELFTIRYYDDSIVEKLSKDRDILIEQISRNTIQLLMKEL